MKIGDKVYRDDQFIGRYRRSTSQGIVLLEKDGDIFEFEGDCETETEEEKDLFLDECSTFARGNKCFFPVLYGLKFDRFYHTDREYPIYQDGFPLYAGEIVKIFVSNYVVVNFSSQLLLLRPDELKFVTAVQNRSAIPALRKLYDSAMTLDIGMPANLHDGERGRITGLVLRRSDRYTPWFLFTSEGRTQCCPWDAFRVQLQQVPYPRFRKYLDSKLENVRIQEISHPYLIESTEMAWVFTRK